MREIIFFLAAIFILSCGTVKRNDTKHIEPIKMKTHSTIAPEFYLDNRIPNCDSAILYMKSTITPGDLTINKLPELSVDATVKGESKEFFSRREFGASYPSDNYPFYVSFRCLKGQDAQVVYDIFVKPKDHKYLKLAEEKANEDDGYYLDVRGLGALGLE